MKINIIIYNQKSKAWITINSKNIKITETIINVKYLNLQKINRTDNIYSNKIINNKVISYNLDN